MLANLLVLDRAVITANAVRTTGATTVHVQQRWPQRRSHITNNVNMHVLHVLVSAIPKVILTKGDISGC